MRRAHLAITAVLLVVLSACGQDFNVATTSGDGDTASSSTSTSVPEGSVVNTETLTCEEILEGIGQTGDQLELLGSQKADADPDNVLVHFALRGDMQVQRDINVDLSRAFHANDDCDKGADNAPAKPANDVCVRRDVMREYMLANGFEHGQFVFEEDFDLQLPAALEAHGGSYSDEPLHNRGATTLFLNSPSREGQAARTTAFGGLNEQSMMLLDSGEGLIGIQALVATALPANYTFQPDGTETTQPTEELVGDIMWYFVNSDCEVEEYSIRAGCGNPQGKPPTPVAPPPPRREEPPPGTTPPPPGSTVPPTTTPPPPPVTTIPYSCPARYVPTVNPPRSLDDCEKLPGSQGGNETSQPDPSVDRDSDPAPDRDPIEPPVQPDAPVNPDADTNGNGEIDAGDDLPEVEAPIADDPPPTEEVDSTSGYCAANPTDPAC